jgi:accessory gene regulator protein AgrB
MDRHTYKFQWVSHKEREHLEGVRIDWRIILIWIFKISMGWLALYVYGLE